MPHLTDNQVLTTFLIGSALIVAIGAAWIGYILHKNEDWNPWQDTTPDESTTV